MPRKDPSVERRGQIGRHDLPGSSKGAGAGNAHSDHYSASLAHGYTRIGWELMQISALTPTLCSISKTVHPVYG
jgi:hypothetical protein